MKKYFFSSHSLCFKFYFSASTLLSKLIYSTFVTYINQAFAHKLDSYERLKFHMSILNHNAEVNNEFELTNRNRWKVEPLHYYRESFLYSSLLSWSGGGFATTSYFANNKVISGNILTFIKEVKVLPQSMSSLSHRGDHSFFCKESNISPTKRAQISPTKEVKFLLAQRSQISVGRTG